jgi:predicted nucleic acid-binding protein
MDRLIAGEFVGTTSLLILAETQHKIMLSLLAVQNGLGRPNLVAWAKHHPDELRVVRGLDEAVHLLHSVPIRVLPIEPVSLQEAVKKSALHGLLTNDSTTLTLMEQNGINDIATNDDDFDRVPGIKVWKPRP